MILATIGANFKIHLELQIYFFESLFVCVCVPSIFYFIFKLNSNEIFSFFKKKKNQVSGKHSGRKYIYIYL